MFEGYKITNHVKERYAQRIMDKDDKLNMNLFITQNEDKIHTDIIKMLEYGNLIYSGKSTCEANGKNVDVYLTDLWVLIVDPKAKTIVTMYKVDLGLGDDFNHTYVSKYMAEIEKAKEEAIRAFENTSTLCNDYRKIMEDNNALIAEYRGYIKSLEAQNEGYKEAIDNNQVNNAIADKNVSRLVARLIGKKEF